jgi:hypothetical protein
MVLHCIIIEGEPKRVELFADLRAMSERFKVLEEEGNILSVTSAEI